MNEQYVQQAELNKELNQLEGLFEQIKNGDIYLYADYIPCAVVSGLSAEYDLEYKDYSGIGRIYEQSASAVFRCICADMCQEAVHLYGLMKETKIFVCTKIYAYLGLKGLIREKLAQIDPEKMEEYEFYAVYHSVPDTQRMQAVYDLLCQNCGIDLFTKSSRLHDYLNMQKPREPYEGVFSKLYKSDDIFTPAERLEFLDSWISFLKKKYESREHSGQGTWEEDYDLALLEEAVEYRGKAGGLLELARLCCQAEPSLYWKALCAEELRGDYAGQLAVGEEALERLGENVHIRGSIALWTAHAAFCVKEYEKAERYCRQAVSANLSMGEYLLVSAWSREPEKLNAYAIEKLLGRCDDDDSNIEWLMGVLERPTVEMQFLFGDYSALTDLYDQEKLINGDIGDVGCGIILLLLSIGKDREWKAGCRYLAALLDNYYIWPSSAGYIQKLKEEEGGAGKVSIFETYFLKWKDRQQTGDELQKLLPYLEVWVDRVIKDSAFGNGMEYRKAAGFAAALGEVKESLGEKDGKQRTLAGYREEFIKNEKKEDSFAFRRKGFPPEKAFTIYLKMFGMKEPA